MSTSVGGDNPVAVQGTDAGVVAPQQSLEALQQHRRESATAGGASALAADAQQPPAAPAQAKQVEPQTAAQHHDATPHHDAAATAAHSDSAAPQQQHEAAAHNNDAAAHQSAAQAEASATSKQTAASAGLETGGALTSSAQPQSQSDSLSAERISLQSSASLDASRKLEDQSKAAGERAQEVSQRDGKGDTLVAQAQLGQQDNAGNAANNITNVSLNLNTTDLKADAQKLDAQPAVVHGVADRHDDGSAAAAVVANNAKQSEAPAVIQAGFNGTVDRHDDGSAAAAVAANAKQSEATATQQTVAMAANTKLEVGGAVANPAQSALQDAVNHTPKLEEQTKGAEHVQQEASQRDGNLMAQVQLSRQDNAAKIASLQADTNNLSLNTATAADAARLNIVTSTEHAQTLLQGSVEKNATLVSDTKAVQQTAATDVTKAAEQAGVNAAAIKTYELNFPNIGQAGKDFKLAPASTINTTPAPDRAGKDLIAQIPTNTGNPYADQVLSNQKQLMLDGDVMLKTKPANVPWNLTCAVGLDATLGFNPNKVENADHQFKAAALTAGYTPVHQSPDGTFKGIEDGALGVGHRSGIMRPGLGPHGHAFEVVHIKDKPYIIQYDDTTRGGLEMVPFSQSVLSEMKSRYGFDSIQLFNPPHKAAGPTMETGAKLPYTSWDKLSPAIQKGIEAKEPYWKMPHGHVENKPVCVENLKTGQIEHLKVPVVNGHEVLPRNYKEMSATQCVPQNKVVCLENIKTGQIEYRKVPVIGGHEFLPSGYKEMSKTQCVAPKPEYKRFCFENLKTGQLEYKTVPVFAGHEITPPGYELLSKYACVAPPVPIQHVPPHAPIPPVPPMKPTPPVVPHYHRPPVTPPIHSRHHLFTPPPPTPVPPPSYYHHRPPVPPPTGYTPPAVPPVVPPAVPPGAYIPPAVPPVVPPAVPPAVPPGAYIPPAVPPVVPPAVPPAVPPGAYIPPAVPPVVPPAVPPGAYIPPAVPPVVPPAVPPVVPPAVPPGVGPGAPGIIIPAPSQAVTGPGAGVTPMPGGAPRSTEVTPGPTIGAGAPGGGFLPYITPMPGSNYAGAGQPSEVQGAPGNVPIVQPSPSAISLVSGGPGITPGVPGGFPIMPGMPGGGFPILPGMPGAVPILPGSGQPEVPGSPGTVPILPGSPSRAVSLVPGSGMLPIAPGMPGIGGQVFPFNFGGLTGIPPILPGIPENEFNPSYGAYPDTSHALINAAPGTPPIVPGTPKHHAHAVPYVHPGVTVDYGGHPLHAHPHHAPHLHPGTAGVHQLHGGNANDGSLLPGIDTGGATTSVVPMRPRKTGLKAQQGKLNNKALSMKQHGTSIFDFTGMGEEGEGGDSAFLALLAFILPAAFLMFNPVALSTIAITPPPIDPTKLLGAGGAVNSLQSAGTAAGATMVSVS